MALLVNAGCGPLGGWLPAMFQSWQQLRVDIDPAVSPDVVASITDMSPIATGTADAFWSAHCVEHLYEHSIAEALSEFYRILAEGGFGCIIVPDLQAIARYIAEDKAHEVIYTSPAGPITAHDMVFGLGSALARGRAAMAHRCGFTPSLMIQRLQALPFGEIILRRRTNALELAAVVRKSQVPSTPEQRAALLAALEL